MSPAEMPLEQRRAHAAKLGGAVQKKYGLTGPQIGILRDAARKYETWNDKTKLHDGQVNMYNVRQDSLTALRDKGYIATVYLYSDAEREERSRRAEEIKSGMFLIARTNEPNDRVPISVGKDEGSYPAWRLVMKELNTVEALLKGNEQKVTRITDAGRAVAAEFKFAIGAEEE